VNWLSFLKQKSRKADEMKAMKWSVLRKSAQIACNHNVTIPS